MFSTIQFIRAQLRDEGIAVDTILDKCAITAAEISDPWPLLSHDQCSTLAREIIRATGDPAIGLTLNKTLTLNQMGIVGFAMLSSPSFREARRVSMRYRILKDPAIFLEHRFKRPYWEMVLHETYPFAEDVQRFFVEGNIVRTWYFCASLTGHSNIIESIQLSYPPPSYEDTYRTILPCPIEFGAEENIIFFKPEALKLRLPLENNEVHTLCVAESEKKFNQLDQVESISTKVYKELLSAHSQDQTMLLGLEDVADRFYMSPRTLRRKLQAEETSFQKITGLVRRDLAIHYLSNTPLSTKEIAYSLGYSSVNNFRRAFKEWTNKKVSDFRVDSDATDLPEP